MSLETYSKGLSISSKSGRLNRAINRAVNIAAARMPAS